MGPYRLLADAFCSSIFGLVSFDIELHHRLRLYFGSFVVWHRAIESHLLCRWLRAIAALLWIFYCLASNCSWKSRESWKQLQQRTETNVNITVYNTKITLNSFVVLFSSNHQSTIVRNVYKRQVTNYNESRQNKKVHTMEPCTRYTLFWIFYCLASSCITGIADMLKFLLACAFQHYLVGCHRWSQNLYCLHVLFLDWLKVTCLFLNKSCLSTDFQLLLGNSNVKVFGSLFLGWKNIKWRHLLEMHRWKNKKFWATNVCFSYLQYTLYASDRNDRHHPFFWCIH